MRAHIYIYIAHVYMKLTEDKLIVTIIIIIYLFNVVHIN